MKNIIKVAVTAALSLSLVGAFASQSEGGFSVGVKGGYNDMAMPMDSSSLKIDGVTVLSVTPKQDHYVADVHVAYLWALSDAFQLGAQLGYDYYGQYKSTVTAGGTSVEGKDKITAPNLQLVGQWNIQQWFIQGRVGAGYFHQSGSASVDGNNVGNSKSSNKAAPIAGVSAGYFFTDNFSGEVFYDHVFGKDYSDANKDLTDNNDDKTPPTMNSIGLGITYSF